MITSTSTLAERIADAERCVAISEGRHNKALKKLAKAERKANSEAHTLALRRFTVAAELHDLTAHRARLAALLTPQEVMA